MTDKNDKSKVPNLKLKHVRINAFFQRIKEKLRIATNNQAVHENQIDEPLFDYFSTLTDEPNEPETRPDNDNGENNDKAGRGKKAKFCRYKKKRKKTAV